MKKERIVFLSIAVAFVAKQILSYFTFGTNDMFTWLELSMGIEKFGTRELYRQIFCNHPPLVLWYLKGLSFLPTQIGIGYPFLFRFLPIAADSASVFIIWKLMGLYGIKYRTVISVLCAFSPVHFLIAGFHGNTDPLFVLLVLASIYLFEKGRYGWMGAVYGLSLCVKIVPVILVPVFLYFLRDWKKAIRFLVPAIAVPLLVFAPYLLHDAAKVISSIFGYGSIGTLWGMGRIAHWANSYEGLPIELRNWAHDFYFWHRVHGAKLFFILLLPMILFFKAWRVNLLEAVFVAFGLFLSVTPGFGMQYLCWIALPAIVIFPVAGSLFNALAGLFLLRVYIFWGALSPPHVADKHSAGWWQGFDDLLCLILWLSIVAMLIAFSARKIRARAGSGCKAAL